MRWAVAVAVLAAAYSSGGAGLREAIVGFDGNTPVEAPALRKQEELRDLGQLGREDGPLTPAGAADFSAARLVSPVHAAVPESQLEELAQTSRKRHLDVAYNVLWHSDGAMSDAAAPFVSDRDTSSRQFISMVMISAAEALALIGLYLCINGRAAEEWTESVREARDSAGTVPWYIVLICAIVYLSLSLGLTVFNKWIFIPEGGNFPFPLTLCFLHLLTTCIVLQVMQWTYPSAMPSSQGEDSPLKMRPMRVYLNASVPGFFLSTSLAYGNISAVSLSVAYATMLKGAKPAIVFLVCLIFGLEHFERVRSILVSGLLCGAVLCIMGETGVHTNGVLIHMISSVADVFRLVSLKLLVSMPDLDPLTALGVYSRVASFLLLPSIIVIELTSHVSSELPGNESWIQHLAVVWAAVVANRWAIFLNCLMAVSLNVSAIVFSKKATPTVVAMTVCVGTMLLMYTSALFFHTMISRFQHIGFAIICVFMCLYQYVDRTLPKGAPKGVDEGKTASEAASESAVLESPAPADESEGERE